MNKKLISVILSISMLFASVSAVFAAPSDIPFDERPLTVNITAINSAIETLEEDLKKSNNFNKVFEDYSLLLELAAQNGDIRQINVAELEKINYGIDTPYSREFVNNNIDEAVKYGQDIKMAVKSILDSKYAEDFTKYWGEEKTAHISASYDNTDKTSKNFYDRYFELIENNADGIEFAKLLNEIITYHNNRIKENSEYNNYIDYLYASNNTGFDTTDVLKYCYNISDSYWYYVNKFKNYGDSLGLSNTSESNEIKNPLETLSYAGKIDPKLKTAYEYLVKNNLFFYGNGLFRGATVPMYSYGDAEIIVSGSNAMNTLIHEFGHYQSFFNTEMSAEDLFFGKQYGSDLQELNSQAFELISTDYYSDIYGEDAEGKKFNKIVELLQNIVNISIPAMVEIVLYLPDFEQTSDEELNKTLTDTFGENWYLSCSYYFTNPGVVIDYSIALFDAVQIYDIYLHDKQAGAQKYLEACSYTNGQYGELTEKLGLVSAFDENAVEYLEKITDDIFKTEYDIDYADALDYFENKTYLGKVIPTQQRVSVNGGEPRTLFAYNNNGYNYIRIRDLAMLLNGTDKQFDVEYDADTFTVNVIPNKPYISDGSEMLDVTEPVETAGQKAAGTSTLLYDGQNVNPGGAIFVNGWNCYLLRGLSDSGMFGISVDYDEANDIVMIYTE